MDHAEIKQLVDLRARLLREGGALVREGNQKIDAANKLVAVIQAIDPDFDATGKSAGVTADVLKPDYSAKDRVGWTEFIMRTADLPFGISLAQLVKEARQEGLWPDRSDEDVRLRLRVTLHALRKRKKVTMHEDGTWETVH